MSNLPIRNALIKAKLTPASIAKEMNTGLYDSTGKIYGEVRDKYVKAIENIPAEKFTNPKDADFKNVFLSTLKKYDFTKAIDRKSFCTYIYNVGLAGEGMGTGSSKSRY